MATSRTTRSNSTRHRRIGAAIALSLGLAAATLSACTNDTRDDTTTTTVAQPLDTSPVAADSSGITADSTSNTASAQALDTGAAADGSLISVLTEDGRYNTLVSALSASGVDAKLGQKGPFTVFAPTDQAFQKLPSDTLARLLLPENVKTLEKVVKYHLIGGLISTASINEGDKDTIEGKKVHFSYVDGEVTINGSPFVSELPASNGIVHGIDFVLVPPDVDLNGLRGTVESAAPTAPVVVGIPLLKTLEEQGTFTTLLTAIEKSGLKEQLSGPGPFTIFAPTDEAFKRLPGDAVTKLLLPQNKEALITLLKHHVIAKRVNGRDLKDKGDLAMLDGSTVKIGIVQGKISVDDATMTYADQEATNGVMHIIDAVLRPSSLDLNALPG
jgi:transforming growth factor-beta-induced protein